MLFAMKIIQIETGLRLPIYIILLQGSCLYLTGFILAFHKNCFSMGNFHSSPGAMKVFDKSSVAASRLERRWNVFLMTSLFGPCFSWRRNNRVNRYSKGVKS